MTQAQLAERAPITSTAPLLSVRDVSVVFGGIIALNGVSFDMQKGHILGLIGPNGAGKTTLFNCLSRLYQPSKGDILMEGQTILKRPAHKISEIGIGRTFQNVALFPNLTVRDNVRVGKHANTNSDIISDSLKLPWVRSGEAAINKDVNDILDYLDLHSVADTVVSGLPFGTQKRVELARALAAEPKILLLDEPAGGLNHEEVYILGSAGRASHGTRDVDRRPRRRAEFRQEARRRNTGCRPERPGCDQGLSGRQRFMTAMLHVKDLRAYYGQVQALHGLEFQLQEGSLTTLLGANGAGKTTTLRAICNMIRSTGSIEFEGNKLTNRSTENIVRLGIAHVPQGRGTFTTMTVEENLQLGAISRKDTKAIDSDIERMYDHFPVLKQRHTQQAGTLSGGEQQMLAVARALMLRPRLMLLDEPSFGLAPLIVRDLFKILGKINREDKVSILVVEQNAQLALELADKAYVIETGRIVMSGTADEIANNEDVRKSYLGY
jgi:branched-chain amino acid transport system ATP-binding protein